MHAFFTPEELHTLVSPFLKIGVSSLFPGITKSAREDLFVHIVSHLLLPRFMELVFWYRRSFWASSQKSLNTLLQLTRYKFRVREENVFIRLDVFVVLLDVGDPKRLLLLSLVIPEHSLQVPHLPWENVVFLVAFKLGERSVLFKHSLESTDELPRSISVLAV